VFPPFEAVWSQLQEWGACPLFQELNALPPEEPYFNRLIRHIRKDRKEMP
jgi:hypothetical protein